MAIFPRVLTAAGAAALLIGVAASAPADEIADVPGWRLAWHDEFDGDTLDTTKWEALDRRNSFNNEKQYYHPDQVVVADGSLQLTAINVPRQGKAYQSGLVTSQDLFGPGRFEARIDLPTSQGMWPAFWLNANHVPWPQGGEIDIMENRGSQPNLVSSAYHWQTAPGPCCGDHEFVYREYETEDANGDPEDYHDSYHVYAAEWDDTTIRFYVDGVLHYTVTGFYVNDDFARPIFETPKNIILNLAVGGTFGGDPNATTVWPQTMHVDYVRYWRRDEVDPPGDFNGDGAVDASDYTAWRDAEGSAGVGLAADGSGNGRVGRSDYDRWATNLGAVAVSRAANVPEPSAAAITSILIVGMRAATSRVRQRPIAAK